MACTTALGIDAAMAGMDPARTAIVVAIGMATIELVGSLSVVAMGS